MGWFTKLFAKTVGEHNKDADDWFGANSWWGKLTGKTGTEIASGITDDSRDQGEQGVWNKLILGFIAYKVFLD